MSKAVNGQGVLAPKARSRSVKKLFASLGEELPMDSNDYPPSSRSLLGEHEQTRILRDCISFISNCGNSELANDLSLIFKKEEGHSGWADKDGFVFSVQDFKGRLEAGVYTAGMKDGQPYLIRESPVTDQLLSLPDSKTITMLHEFDRFWGLEGTFGKFGFLHKRGFFLVGAPGAGKTASVQLLSKALVEKFDGVVLYLENPMVAYACLRMIRSIEPTRRIVCVLEDLDSLIDTYEEADFLSLFDGEKSIDHVVFVATTNYPEDIDKRFLDRPSRFDQVITIDLPSFADRLFYLKNRTSDIDDATLEKWAIATKGFGIAHLKEIIISVTCFGYTFEETLKRLHEQQKTMNSSKLGGKVNVGFSK